MRNRPLTPFAFAVAAVLASAAATTPRPAQAETHGEALVAALPSPIGITEKVPLHARSGFALNGLDPVSYFLPDGPQAGRESHERVWLGAAWRFASAANRAAFEAGPERFAPRLGGHDPLALAQGRLLEGRADLFAVVDGRLYLFHDPESLARFTGAPEDLAAAEAAWVEARRDLVDPASGHRAGAPPHT